MINDNKYLVAYFFHPSSNPSMEYVEEFDELPDELEKHDWAAEIELVKVRGRHSGKFGKIWDRD